MAYSQLVQTRHQASRSSVSFVHSSLVRLQGVLDGQPRTFKMSEMDPAMRLRAALAAKARECTELAHRLDAAASAIAALHHDNALLRQELDHRGQLVGLSSRA